MSDEVQTAWSCPKDGTSMAPMGRRAGAWRCPSCRAIFIDTEALRKGRPNGLPIWAPFVMSVAMSLLATAIARRLRHRRESEPTAQT